MSTNQCIALRFLAQVLLIFTYGSDLDRNLYFSIVTAASPFLFTLGK